MSVRVCGLKIDAQTESCELRFAGVGVLMRTIVQDTASQMALRNCLPEVGIWQRSVYMWFWWKGIHSVKHTFWQRLAASAEKVADSHKEQMSLLMILVLF